MVGIGSFGEYYFLSGGGYLRKSDFDQSGLLQSQKQHFVNIKQNQN